ncbi:THAP-type domain-containing protein [Trichonephila clavipes]|nr:THAP-type domain-containing protein [Trichonephila clavipes]
MEIPLRTAYGQNGRCGMQPKPSSLRAQAHQSKSRTETEFSRERERRTREVCELHFSDDAIRRYTEAYNERTGEKICVPLKRYRLENFAVATIFTDFPTYLSNSGNLARECPEQRLQRLENEHLQHSIQASIISKEEFEKKKSFTSFPELVECLNAEELQDIWTVIFKKDLVIIMMLDTIISPVIKASVIINKDLHLTIPIGQTKIDQLDPVVVYKQRNLGVSLTPPKRVTRFPRLEEGNEPINTSWYGMFFWEFPAFWRISLAISERMELPTSWMNMDRTPHKTWTAYSEPGVYNFCS